jgi:hypothetical protein
MKSRATTTVSDIAMVLATRSRVRLVLEPVSRFATAITRAARQTRYVRALCIAHAVHSASACSLAMQLDI